MADKKISQLSNATTPLTGSETLPVVQSGSTLKTTVADLTAGRSVSALTYSVTINTASSFGARVTNMDFQLYATNGVSTSNAGDVKATIGLYFANNIANLNGGIQFTRGGSGTDGGLNFLTSGTERMRITGVGSIVAGASAALATTATDGFLYVPTCAGTPTGTPSAITGMAPIVVNTTNNKLYFYSGGAWRDAGP